MRLAVRTSAAAKLKQAKRWYRRDYHELSYTGNGEPAAVLSFQKDASILDSEPAQHGLVKVDMLHVPWNPADVNTVQGKYPSPYSSIKEENRPSAKSRYFYEKLVAGSEEWGRVSSSNGSNLAEGSLVAIGSPALGTLRSSLWAPESSLLRIPEKLLEVSGPGGCTLPQLGGTAFRMLYDFGSLKAGDVVLQNAGNSGVGFMASQIASEMLGVSVVSLVRRGSKNPKEYNDLVRYLREIGKAALVVAEEDIQDKQSLKNLQSRLRDLSASGELPKLALNAVGGESAKQLLRAMAEGGTLVTYGGMSGEPVVAATPQLIFKDVNLRGYWHSRWMTQQSQTSKQEMMDALAKSVVDGSVACPPVRVFPLHDVQRALHWQSSPTTIRQKLVWDCGEHTEI